MNLVYPIYTSNSVTLEYHVCHISSEQKNLPFSVKDVKNVCKSCQVCAEIKPRFYEKPKEKLIKAMRPRERISIDFKGSLDGRNKYILFVINEFSRYPFAFPCHGITTATVILYLTTLFCVFGFPSYVHSDRGSSFMSKELQEYLTTRGIATSRSTPYHPTGNSQCERINQTVWKTVKLFLGNYELPQKAWESVLPEALHSVQSLLCTHNKLYTP